MEKGDRVVVGLNAFTIDEEPSMRSVHRTSSESAEKQIARVKQLKETVTKKGEGSPLGPQIKS